MNAYYTLKDVAPKITNINNIAGGVEIVFDFLDGGIKTVVVTPEAIFADTRETAFSDCTTYYGIVALDGEVLFSNRYLVTYYTKDSGVSLCTALQDEGRAAIQLYIPYGGNSLDDAVIRVTSSEVPAYNGTPLPPEKHVGGTEAELTAFRLATLPSMTATIVGDKVQVQVTREGQPITRSGVLVYAIVKDSFNYTTGLTDANGGVAFDIVPNATVKFGFKYFTNVVSITT